jgi:translocation and assembly module TamB
MKKILALLVLALLLLLPVGLYGLLNSHQGSRWLIRQVLAVLPGNNAIAKIEGSLLNDLTLNQLHYESANERVDVNSLHLSWQVGRLFQGVLKINDLDIDGIQIQIKPHPPEPASDFDWHADSILPVELIVDKLTLRNLQYQDGDATPYTLQQLSLSTVTEQDQLIIKSLNIEALPLKARAAGQIRLGKLFPFTLSTQWQIDTSDDGLWQGQSQLQGDANQIQIDHQQATPFLLSLKGQMANLQTKPEAQIRGDWQKLNWPLLATEPQVSSAQGYFEMTGPLDDYQLSLNGPLTQSYLPGAQIHFKGKGRTDALDIEALKIESDAGALSVDGQVDWQSETHLALNMTAKQFNPALFLPELPGQLTFESHINAQFGEFSPKIQFALNNLSGQLRGNPIEAKGKLDIADQNYNIDHLNISSGRNRINANGLLSPALSNLTVDIDTPVLASFWPGLSGSLKASGNIQGNWQNPSVQLQAKGNQLQFETHKIDQLVLNVDYQPNAQKTSKLQLDASQIKTGDAVIASMQLKGDGTLPQHQFSLALKSNLVNLSGDLTGSLKDQNWLASLNKLNLDGPNFGSWHLQSASKIQAQKQTQGYDLQLSGFCLLQHPSSFCANTLYQANSDYKLQLKASALPTALLQAFMPPEMHLNGLMDAEADFQQQKGQLSGNYRLGMPSSKISMSQGHKNREFALGALNLSGQIKNNLLSTDVDLGLTQQDFIRAKLQFNTKAANSLSGQIHISMTEWDLIQPILPSVTDLSGQMTANLNLQGDPAFPLISGQIDLHEGAMEIASAGLALQHINLQAQANGGKTNHMVIKGTAVPFLLPNPETHQQMQFDGTLALSAELDQINKQFSGHYQLNIPANSSLSFKSAQSNIQVPFAASTLTGDIQGDQFSANLDLLMLNQDFLRARLHASTGKTQNLSGNIQASMLDLTLFNALLPDVSHIKGQLKADLSVQGTTAQPVAQGTLELLQGAANVDSLGIILQDINLQLSNSALKDEHLVLTGKAKSGQGQLSIHGLLHLNGDLDISLQGLDFEVAKLPEAQIAISPDLKLVIADHAGKASGKLEIPKAIIVMEDLPQNAVKVSEDEVILGKNTENTLPKVDTDWETNIDVILGKKVSFSGQGLSTELNGQLKIGKSEDNTSLHGTIDMKNGRYKSYGQDLTVRKGRFMFNGPIDAPWLDVEAVRVSKDQKITAILGLSGPLKTPKTRIYSEPALPEAEALAYLITGSPLNEVGKTDGNMVAGAALSYGVGKLSWLTEKLGVDEFEVKEGKTLNDTLISMGEYLTEDFYIGTKIGIFDTQAVLVLRHNLTKNFKIETQAGTSQRVKINYEVDTD